MEEMLYKFINEGKQEHEEMRTFICEFRTTNKILFKERNNSLSELRFEVQELLKVINNTPMTNYKIKGVTTIGGKTTTQDVQNNNANLHTEEPLVVNHDKPVESIEVLTNDQPQKTNKPVVQPSSEKQISPVPFPQRLRKEKEEAQQKKFLENLKQLHINLPFIEALAQMPKYAKFLKGDDEVIFDGDQSIKRPPVEDDKCYGVDDIDDMINAEAQKLLANDKSDTFLLKGLKKSINQSDLENYESFECKAVDNSNSGEPIRHINSVNTPYPAARKTTEPKVESEHLYLTSANKIDEKKPELKNLPHHLEYA
ncbi:hypothetical protein Tco_1560794 [Tanacetum coccineum]